MLIQSAFIKHLGYLGQLRARFAGLRSVVDYVALEAYKTDGADKLGSLSDSIRHYRH